MGSSLGRQRRLQFTCLVAMGGLAATATAAQAQAQDPSAGGRPAVESTGSYLQRMDADTDGRISLEEYQAWMGYGFAQMDRDGNGVLTPEELPGGRGKPIPHAAHVAQIAQRFARQDANGDGYLSAAELAAPPR